MAKITKQTITYTHPTLSFDDVLSARTQHFKDTGEAENTVKNYDEVYMPKMLWSEGYELTADKKGYVIERTWPDNETLEAEEKSDRPAFDRNKLGPDSGWSVTMTTQDITQGITKDVADSDIK